MNENLKFGKVEFPTLNIKDLDIGDFVYLLYFGTLPSYGVIVKKYNENIRIRHFEKGFPLEINRMPKFGFVRKTSKEEALKHFQNISSAFDRDIEVGNLSGAILARKQYYLDGIISQLEQEKYNIISAITSTPKSPMTGIYILNGIYTGENLGNYFEKVSILPRLSEDVMSKQMIKFYPFGFGRIPEKSNSDSSFMQSFLFSYKTYEIPEKALEFIKNPIKLGIRNGIISFI